MSKLFGLYPTMSKEGQRKLRIMRYGTQEERKSLLQEMKATIAAREHATVAEEAYLLWEAAGKPEERDVEFWLTAEAQLKQERDDYIM